MFFFAKNQHDVCPNSKKAHKTFEKHYNMFPNVIFIQSFLIILFVLFLIFKNIVLFLRPNNNFLLQKTTKIWHLSSPNTISNGYSPKPQKWQSRR